MPKASIAILLALSAATQAFAQDLSAPFSVTPEADYPLKYAIYSSAWGTRSDAGLRLVAQNLSDHEIILESVLFQDEEDPQIETQLALDMTIAPNAWAEKELSYVDLLFGNECIGLTMNQDWKLVEISNYTLNPSVRGLIIEDTDSFRIYQCVRNVRVSWMDTETGEKSDYTEWVMYHFERPRPY
tara:strand:+ start:54 stop:608 length:555 start_codon:yes stop_codon:yes gene_type:complete